MNVLLSNVKKFLSFIPHCQQLGVDVAEVSKEHLTLCLPVWSMGNKNVSVQQASGVLSVLMDTACGATVLLASDTFRLCATLDLHLNFLTERIFDQRVLAKATCFHREGELYHTRAEAYFEDESEPFLMAFGTFIEISHSRIAF